MSVVGGGDLGLGRGVLCNIWMIRGVDPEVVNSGFSCSEGEARFGRPQAVRSARGIGASIRIGDPRYLLHYLHVFLHHCREGRDNS